MKKMFSIFLMLVFFTSLLTFSGCKNDQKPDGKTDKEVKIVFWHTMNEQEVVTLTSVIDEFEAANPNIKVELEYVPFGDAQNKFKVAAGAGNAPDVLRCEIAWTPEFASLGYLLDISKYVTAADKNDYLKAPFAYNMYQGKTYGIPQVTDAPALLYNKRLLKEAGYDAPPKTLDEMEKVVADVKSKLGIEGFYMRGDAYWFQCFLWAFGGGLIDDDKNIFINNDKSIQAMEYVVSQKDKLFPGNIDFANDYNNAMAQFKDGDVAMIINGPWASSDILSGAEFSDPSNFGVAPFPKGPGGQGSPVGGHNYVIYAGAENPDETYKFINFINQAKYQAIFAVKNNLLPTRKSAYEIGDVKANDVIQGFKAQMEVATNRPVIPEGGMIYTDFTPNYQAAWRGDKTPKEACDDIAKAWAEFLNK